MNNTLNKEYTGIIILWNGSYGFIENVKGDSYFFHKSNVDNGYLPKIKLLDRVTFTLSIVQAGRHKGKTIAIDIKYHTERNLLDFDRHIGMLKSWTGRFGDILSPQIEKPILFFITRRLDFNNSFNINEPVVFCPVKSTKHNYKLFALFAYPLSIEKDFDFLITQYQNSQQDFILEHINKLLLNDNNIDLKQKFDIEFQTIGFVDTFSSFNVLKTLLTKYKNRINITYEELRKRCDEKYLLQLLELDIIDVYDKELLKVYFHNANADTKKNLLYKISKEDTSDLLLYHFESLKSENRLNYLNNNVKLLLRMVYTDENTRDISIFNAVKEHLKSYLSPDDIIYLWLNNYYDNPSEKFIIQNFDIENESLIKSLLDKEKKNEKSKEGGNEKYALILFKLYEKYFLSLTEDDFDNHYCSIIKRLLIFEDKFAIIYKEKYNAAIRIINTKFNDFQKFILHIFDVSTSFDIEDFFIKNHKNINPYYFIRFILKNEEITKQLLMNNQLSLSCIDMNSLKLYIGSNPWNSLIKPTAIYENESRSFSFLDDIQCFIKKYNSPIDISELAIYIFNNMDFYNEHHIRLWLYEYVPVVFYNYIGFRNAFKNLPNDEKDLFKKKADAFSFQSDVYNPEINSVEPCNNIIEKTNDYIIYSAGLHNLYFGNEFFMLRKEDGVYTTKKEEPYSSSGLNRIPKSNRFNQIIIKVDKNNSITSIEGLSEIFTLIHTGQIEKALGKVSSPLNISKTNKSYIEDWKLRKEIIKYLNDNQCDNIDIVKVREPHNYYRRLDEKSGIDEFQLTHLYTIELSDGYGIIWENIDLSDDKATYIFKSTFENVNTQLIKIKNEIVSKAQFRSSLISRKANDSCLDIYRRNLGYIGSIRKQRGKILSFENWLVKLNKCFYAKTPILPNDNELEKLEHWEPLISHQGKVSVSTLKRPNQDKIKRTPIENIKETSFDFENDGSSKKSLSQNRNFKKKEIIYKSLLRVNELINNNLNI